MKSKHKIASARFEPIEFTLTIETAEELKQFLLLMSVCSDSISYDDDEMSYIEFDDESIIPSPSELAAFADSMISNKDWCTLRDVYIKHQAKIKD